MQSLKATLYRQKARSTFFFAQAAAMKIFLKANFQRGHMLIQ